MKQDHPRHPHETSQDVRQDSPPDVLDRITVAQAADRLGITQDAVRKRIARGTIRHDKDHEGRIFVYLDTFERASETAQDDGQDEPSKTDQDANRDKYTRSLEDQIEFLRQELERKDAILMTMARRIPELEAASEPRESPKTASEETDQGGNAPEHQESSQRPSWWKRFFGLE